MEFMNNPRVTVCMPVYNRVEHLRETIDSILGQTFTDFELLIIDDGSTEDLSEILGQYDDFRMSVFRNEANMGIARARNRGLKLAKGEYIAWMDSDDISLPHRLESQVAFMDSHPEIDLCGTWLETFGDKKSIWKLPVEHGDIFAGMLFECMLYQSTVIMRKKNIFRLNGFYDDKFLTASDYEYWVRLGLAGAKFSNIGEVCFKYRLHDKQISRIKKAENRKYSDGIRTALLKSLGINFSEHEFGLHMILKSGHPSGKKTVEEVSAWIDKIRVANRGRQVFSEEALDRAIGRKWFQLCRNSSSAGLGIWKVYHENSAAESVKLSMNQKVKFFAKCLLSVNSKRDLLRFKN